MDSPGHRRNILTPSHTHVGVGFAYNPQSGTFYLAQEFASRYVIMQPLPASAHLGEQIVIIGQVLSGATRPTINLTYQPFPAPLSRSELNQTGSYRSNSIVYQPIAPQPITDDSFQTNTQLDYRGKTGLYSVRIWVSVRGQDVLASEWVIEVQ